MAGIVKEMLFQPGRSVHSVSSHIHRALGHAGQRVKEAAGHVAEEARQVARVGGAIVETAGAARGLYEATKHHYGRHVSTIDRGLRGCDSVRQSLGV